MARAAVAVGGLGGRKLLDKVVVDVLADVALVVIPLNFSMREDAFKGDGSAREGAANEPVVLLLLLLTIEVELSSTAEVISLGWEGTSSCGSDGVVLAAIGVVCCPSFFSSSFCWDCCNALTRSSNDVSFSREA